MAAALGVGPACGFDPGPFENPVQIQDLLATSGPELRLYGAGFGDDTLRVWSADGVLVAQEVLGPEGVSPGTGSIPLRAVEGLSGVWGLARTDAGRLLATSKLGQALLLFSTTGPLQAVQTVRQGASVESQDPAQGLLTARGLQRVGAVAVEGGWVHTAGLDGLGVFRLEDQNLRFASVNSDLRGADDLLVVTTATQSESGRILMSKCRQLPSDGPCLSATDPAEVVVAERSGAGAVQATFRWAYDAEGTDGSETLLGDGHLARSPSGGDALAVFEGSATVLRLQLAEDGTFTSTGAFRLVAPWQDPEAPPAFDSGVVSTSTLAPIRAGQMAVLQDTVFVAVRTGGYVAHFPADCVGPAPPVEACFGFTCLDPVGGCAVPSDGSETPTYPFAVAAEGRRVFVGLDVRSADGRIVSQVAILERADDGSVALLGIFDAAAP